MYTRSWLPFVATIGTWTNCTSCLSVGFAFLQLIYGHLVSSINAVGAFILPFHFIFWQVLRTAVSNRLAKVQGFLFRAAFLRRVPTFFRLIFENILLCFLQSTLLSTSKYITGTVSLQFRKILTRLIHTQYFQVQSDTNSEDTLFFVNVIFYFIFKYLLLFYK